jgi:RimJ/RimL family protein N-acetyltransferase
MTNQPNIETKRILLRPFVLVDAPEVQRLAGEKAIASTTLAMPHPYEDGMAEAWISSHKGRFERNEEVVYAITLSDSGQLVGAIGLVVTGQHDRAELGYWVGKPFWGNGYATEAGRAIIRFGFESMNLNRIYASHFIRNPASGRVMEKIGMRFEGSFRQHVKRWDVYEDLHYRSILRQEFYQEE